MPITLTGVQKEEVRRLTQKANRRIKSYITMYEKAGYKTIPKEVTAGFNVQTRKQFVTDNYALSRSVKFESQQDYKRHINMLKRFDGSRVDGVPSVREYNKISRSKLMQAFETSNVEMNKTMLKKIKKMNAAEISDFWKEYQVRARRKGLQYSSEAVMIETAESFSPGEHRELIKNVFGG